MDAMLAKQKNGTSLPHRIDIIGSSTLSVPN